MITNIDRLLVCKECAQERELEIKLDEEIDVEKFFDYVQDYFQLTPSDEQKGIRELHEDLNKQIYNRQTTYHHDSFCMSRTVMVQLPPLISCVTGKKKKNASTNIIFLFIFLSKPNIMMVTPDMKHSTGTVSTSNGSLGCRS